MSRLAALVAFGALLATCVAGASPASAAAARARVLSVLITAPAGMSTGTQCTNSDYSDMCSSGTSTCDCMNTTATSVRGTLVGKGSSITGNLHLGEDHGAATNVDNTSVPGCTPVYGDFALTNGSLGLGIFVLLTSCPTNRAGTSTLNGGWSIDSATNDETGGGSATGTIKNGIISLRLVGAVTPAAM